METTNNKTERAAGYYWAHSKSIGWVIIQCVPSGYFYCGGEDTHEESEFYEIDSRPIVREPEKVKENPKVSELLAVLHGDGGHYESEHGTTKAIIDAIHLGTEHSFDLFMAPVLPEEVLVDKQETEPLTAKLRNKLTPLFNLVDMLGNRGIPSELMNREIKIARENLDAIRELITQIEISEPKEEISDHPEATCQACGGRNINWYADNTLFNEVNGSPNGIVCPECFRKAAEAKGIKIYFKAEVIDSLV